MKKKIYIRADGNPEIGLGHMIRCLAFAQMMMKEFDVFFISKEIPEKIMEELNNNQIHYELIKEEALFFAKLNSNDIVVLDGYNFGAEYQKIIKSTGCILVCIDDLHDKEFFADLIINHAPGVTPKDYLAQSYTQFALGTQYALLRHNFLAQSAKPRQIEKTETVLICFGGSDHKNLTEGTLETVLTFRKFKKIIVITGAAFSYLNSLKRIINQDDRISHYNAIGQRQMLSLMLEVDLAIVPASGILLESLAAGCTVISGYYADNQMGIYNGFLALSSFTDAGNFDSEHLTGALNRAQGNSAIRIFDGKSGFRLLERIQNLYNVSSDIS